MDETEDKKKAILQAYYSMFVFPFFEKYDETWEEDTFWATVETFKTRSKEVGCDDPFEILREEAQMESYTQIREKLMEGPPACFRRGWISPFVGTKVDALQAIEKLDHVHGAEFTGKERVVVFDFWATWCGPCVKEAPMFSELVEKNAGRLAFIGINNDGIFQARERDVEKVRSFLEKHIDDFRYTVYVDSKESYAKEELFSKVGFKAIPCVIIIVDGVVTYAGSSEDAGFRASLDEALKLTDAAKEE